MAPRVYPWKRYWTPRTARLDLSDNGYLSDPETEYGRLLNSELVLFPEIASKHCLVLLGEPGIGKTATLRLESERHKETAVRDGNQLCDFIDLRAYGDERRLIDRLFESPTARQWKAGAQRLHLFLDSLDECLLRIDTVAALLPEELSKQPLDRLSLRIACRTAVWPLLLEEELKQLWSEEQIGVYELAPLRRRDVEVAVQDGAIDPQAFFREIDRTEAVPLAIKPVTLMMLLNVYSREGSLPGDRWSLYERGCRLLTEEINPSRLAAHEKGRLTAEQRLAVAGRVAAVTVIANRYAVWTSPDLGDAPPGDVRLPELAGGTENLGGDEIAVSHEEIEETLDTGLYTSRGPGRLAWAHQTYAEFLAARYLTQHNLTLTQILGLIRHPSGKLVPQLQELSAWLATRRDDIFAEVLSSDPEVLIRSDVASADEATRAKLTDSLLAALDSQKLHDMSLDLVRHYGKLAHGNLATQLRPYIVDRGKGLIVRRVAILIAKQCREKALSQDLLSIAFDENDDEHVRSLAIIALGECADEDVRAALKPLVVNPSPADIQDEIKGCALTLLWPKHLTVSELFAALTPSRRPEVFGTYRGFISTHVARHLTPDDLPHALAWVQKLETGPSPQAFSRDFEMAALADHVVLAAIENLAQPVVTRALVGVLMQRFRSYYWSAYPDNGKRFDTALKQSGDRRRLLIDALTPEMKAERRDAVLVSRLLTHEDLPWLVEQVLRYTATDEIRARTFAVLAGATPIVIDDTKTFEVLYEASQRSPLIAEQFAWLLNPVDLESEKAAELRQYYQASRPQPKTSAKIYPLPSERILKCLEELEAGSTAAWWHLNYWMLFDSDRQQVGDLEADLTKTPGWRDADDPLHTRLIRGAETYLRKGDPDNDQWLGTDNLDRPSFAGYRAFRLLYTGSPSALETLDGALWRRWAAIIVAYPTDSDELPIQQALIALAYAQAPDDVLQTFDILAKRAIAKGEASWLRIELDKLRSCPSDDVLKSTLLGMLNDPALNPDQTGPLLAELFRRYFIDVTEFARSCLKPPLPAEEAARKRALVAARELLLSTERGTLDTIWPAIESTDSFGEALFLDLAQHAFVPLTSGRILSNLTEHELANLFVWLEHHFPRSSDPDHRGQAHAVGPRESLAQLRDAVLQVLQVRGTNEAVQELQRIKLSLPEYNWLYTVVLNAQNEMLRKTWLPSSPGEILSLARSSDNRLIATPNQLLDVLLESLDRLQREDLKGETGRVKFLWNETPDHKWRPKDEPSLSDYIKGFLQRDLKDRGIIVNREVEVYRPAGAGKGPATDIHVDVIVPNPNNRLHLKAVIEVKGCWNRELKTSIQAQLIDKYLQGPDCQHGIYLVGWFDPEHWDDSDYRKRDAHRWTIQETREFFANQAAQHSTADRPVQVFVLDGGF
jgi:predicted NACHT family NTPase